MAWWYVAPCCAATFVPTQSFRVVLAAKRFLASFHERGANRGHGWSKEDTSPHIQLVSEWVSGWMELLPFPYQILFFMANWTSCGPREHVHIIFYLNKMYTITYIRLGWMECVPPHRAFPVRSTSVSRGVQKNVRSREMVKSFYVRCISVNPCVSCFIDRLGMWGVCTRRVCMSCQAFWQHFAHYTGMWIGFWIYWVFSLSYTVEIGPLHRNRWLEMDLGPLTPLCQLFKHFISFTIRYDRLQK